jgi:hypothetical protein
VTLRRLNRAEYNNTIRDLVGVDFQPAADFPADDVGYGFDNIGDVLTISPILIEKYLAAAEQIVQQAIVPDPIATAPTRRLERRSFEGAERLGPRLLLSRKEAAAPIRFEREGEYLFRVHAFSSLSEDDPPRLTLLVDEQEVLSELVRATREQPQTYEARARVPAGTRKLVLRHANPRPEVSGQGQGGDRKSPLLLVESVEVRGPVDPPPSHQRIITCRPDAQRGVHECAREILRTFASRAFRRPVTDEELERLLGLVKLAQDQGDGFEQSIQLALQAVLTSPHFLFRVERDPEPGDPGGVRTLDDYELASRLSYFLWSSMPDAELFTLAREHRLRDPAVLEAQVRRMLRDPKAIALVNNFAGQWLQLRDLAKVTPDPEAFGEFDEELRAAMLRETELFFQAVMQEDRSILDFLDADFSFINERLARHYGISEVKGSEFRRVSLEGSGRRGVLMQASILTLTSNPTRTSPVKRGKWILENFLATPPPPPPAGVEELKEDEDAVLSGSLRQRMEQHRAKPMCAACHSRMDPLGFAFENFDAIGAWRDFDGKFAIDPTGALPGGESFDGARGLAELLKDEKRQDFCRCLTEKLLTYGLGRGLEYYDRCVVEEIADSLAQNDYRFSGLILGIVRSDPFQKRGVPGGEE